MIKACTCESAQWNCRPAEGNEGLVPRLNKTEELAVMVGRMRLLVFATENCFDKTIVLQGATPPTTKFSLFALLQRSTLSQTAPQL